MGYVTGLSIMSGLGRNRHLTRSLNGHWADTGSDTRMTSSRLTDVASTVLAKLGYEAKMILVKLWCETSRTSAKLVCGAGGTH